MPPELTAALALCRNLPSPPGIALRIIELAQDPEADIATAADIIAIDMALSARMLRIAIRRCTPAAAASRTLARH